MRDRDQANGPWRPLARGARISTAPVLAAALLLLAGVAPASARSRRVSLAAPSSVAAGSRVLVTGSVSRARRARRVVLQGRRGARWVVLGRARVSRHRFRVAFTAPNADAVLVVRAVVHRRRRRALISPSRTIIVRVARAPRAPVGVTVAGWGNNGHRQLGAGFKNPFSALPVSALEISGVQAVAATYFSSYALLEDGTVRAWGGNAFGQLGIGSLGQPSINPVQVAGLTGVTAIAASGTHVMALLSNGTVATWGGNAFGEMGNGTTFHGAEGIGSLVPQIVPGLTGVVAIAAGGADDAALLSNGTVVAWGENKQGQLGDGTRVEKTVPTPVSGLSNVKAIAFGGISSLGGHMLALLGDGTVRAVGGNSSGQLGDGTTTNSSAPVVVKGLSGVTAIAASVSHSMARLQNGTVMTWGNDAYGELGTGAAPETCGAERIGCSRVPVPVGLSDVEAVSAGFRFSLAVSGGRVSAWGLNDSGQLGNGTTTNSSLPVPVSSLESVAAISAGEVHSLALLHGAGPAPTFTVVPGRGSLTISWVAPPTSEPWSVSWRPIAHPPLKWTPFVPLAPTARSYTVTGLLAQPYEVVVRNKALGAKNITGTPLP